MCKLEFLKNTHLNRNLEVHFLGFLKSHGNHRYAGSNAEEKTEILCVIDNKLKLNLVANMGS